MPISIEEAKAFITSASKSRENWLMIARRSWNEIKKRQKNDQLWALNRYGRNRRGGRYPAWYSIFKIRQPLVLSRVGIPIGKDTTQDGSDNIGATAAICLERLAVNLAKSFDFFDVMASARDDFLATNIGQVRAYYERDVVKERVKQYVTPQKTPEGDVVFVDENGDFIVSDDIGQDDEGYFLETEQIIDVENEKVCLEPVLYTDFYIDPDIRRYSRCKRMAFATLYSREEFKRIFGTKALLDIPSPTEQLTSADESATKRQVIRVFEYWDDYEKECLWFTEEGPDFITPKDMYMPDTEEYQEEGQELNGLYNLNGFFPCPPPLVMNAPTDEFWPVPEYYQLIEIFEDIHTIFSRMMALTRAIRVRLLFDNNIDGLQSAMSEAAEGDAFGVPNLAQSLSSAGGSLDNVVQYIPVENLINGLGQMYTALEQRLNTVYKLTGTSDLLQGLVTDPTQRTFGERQMTEKYALNQLEEPQRKMQEFVKDSYQLMCEVALKNFKDESLDQYIMPGTLDPSDQGRYRAALGMLKQNTKRFRIELETDSTIAINEEYDKQARAELVSTLSGSIEKVANIAQTSPELLGIELHAMKYLIQGLRQGKMFQSEITEAIDQVIEITKQPKPPPFDKDAESLKLEAQKLDASNKIEVFKLQSTERLEGARIAQTERIEAARIQLDQFKMQLEQARIVQDDRLAGIQAQVEAFKTQQQGAIDSAQLQFDYQKLSSDIALAQEELSAKRDALMVEMKKIADSKSIDQFGLMIEKQIADADIALRTTEQQIEAQKAVLDEREKYMTEARLQSEHELDKQLAQVEMISKIKDVGEAKTVTAPAYEKKIKIKKDAKTGVLTNFEATNKQS